MNSSVTTALREQEISAVTTQQVIAIAEALAPRFKERAMQTDRDRAVPRISYDEMREAGLFNILKPKKYGGYEMTCHEHAMVTLILAQACASTAWVFSLLNVDNMIILAYPERTQEEIWGTNPDATLAGSIFLNGKSKATRVDGGYRLSGSWGFCSGSDFAEWLVFNAVVDDDPRGYWFLVPKDETTMVDDWHPVGMRGTGSRTREAQELFVPEHRVIPSWLAYGNPEPKKLHPSFATLQLPVPFGAFYISAVTVGAAAAAVSHFAESAATMTRKAGALGGDLRLADQDLVAAEFAEAAAEIDMARMLIEQRSKEAGRRVLAGDWPDAAEVASDQRDNAYVARVALRVVQKIHALVGAKAGFPDHPISRAKRDVEVGVTHSTINWRQAAVGYLQSLTEPDTPMASR